jgi:hypothetical protein
MTKKVDLEQFMLDVQKGTGFTFNTFHTILEILCINKLKMLKLPSMKLFFV